MLNRSPLTPQNRLGLGYTSTSQNSSKKTKKTPNKENTVNPKKLLDLDPMEELKSELDVMKRQLKKSNEERNSLRSLVGGLENRVEALNKDHRAYKSKVDRERLEMEKKCFESRSLVSSLQGELRKKDQAYDKLQTLLSKVNTLSKRSDKASITISKPLQKNSSQNKNNTKMTTLKDAEIIACRAENEQLKRGLNGLSSEISMLWEHLRSNEPKHKEREEIMNELEDMRTKICRLIMSDTITNSNDNNDNNAVKDILLMQERLISRALRCQPPETKHGQLSHGHGDCDHVLSPDINYSSDTDTGVISPLDAYAELELLGIDKTSPATLQLLKEAGIVGENLNVSIEDEK
jgi:hypothetical protein